MIQIEINNQQSILPVDRRRWKRVARSILKDQGIKAATISLAVVDDQSICELNRRYLGHDCPTDCLSFVLERTEDRLEGEVIVSAEMAVASAPRYDQTSADELLLYVIHGLLHLVGFDDQDPQARALMKARERYYLAQCNRAPGERDRSISRMAAPALDRPVGKRESGP